VPKGKLIQRVSDRTVKTTKPRQVNCGQLELPSLPHRQEFRF
jgi:hypothetical protein